MGNDINNRNRIPGSYSGNYQRTGTPAGKRTPSSHNGQTGYRTASERTGANTASQSTRSPRHETSHSNQRVHSDSGHKAPVYSKNIKSLRKKAEKKRYYSKRYEINSTVVLAVVSVVVCSLIAVGVIISQSKLHNAHSGNAGTDEDGTREALEQQMEDMFSEYELYSLEIKEVEPEREFPLIRVYNSDGQLSLSPIRLADGSIEGTVAYEYRDDGSVMIERKYSKTGRLLYKDVFGGKDEGTARTLYETEFDSKGNYSGYTETLYNSDGVEIGKTKCSANGVVEGKYDYVYDENGRVSRENRYTPYGELSVFTEYKYDFLGNVTEKIQCDSTGKEVLRDVTTYDDSGRKTLEQHYTMGVCKSYTEYSYDEAGNVIEKSYMLVDEYNMTYKEVTN